jgi:mannose-1-phosphate guanylyltransferase/mannose-6-phosphate isomerase
MIVPVILSGGSGTRLWPVSTNLMPKQLLPLVTSRSMLQDTVTRLDALGADLAPPLIVCDEAHGDEIRKQLDEIDCSAVHLIFEPEGRNTAPAAALGALVAEQQFPGEDPTLLILPADHSIGNSDEFSNATKLALDAATSGMLVTYGIVPDKPETGFGYIERGDALGSLYTVNGFVEKPLLEAAQEYVASGRYYWNSGMFLFSSESYLAELTGFRPEIVAACRLAVDGSTLSDRAVNLDIQAFLACPPDSIDYAVMENTSNAVVVPLDAQWSDVGSWAGLHDISERDSNGNACVGESFLLDCQESLIWSEDRLVVAVGLEGHIVVDTPNALLIMPKDRAQDVKDIITALKASKDGSEDG